MNKKRKKELKKALKNMSWSGLYALFRSCQFLPEWRKVIMEYAWENRKTIEPEEDPFNNPFLGVILRRSEEMVEESKKHYEKLKKEADNG